MSKKTIYTIACSHLDTSWVWDLETSITHYIPATIRNNISLFEKYPEYRFGWEGSYRYELAEEYYPDEFEKMKKYIEDGKWYPIGSAYENGDVNTPSPEALIRNILFGTRYFREKFSTESNDIFLPDCFGFGYALPSIMRHCSLKGFSTQKLSWGSAFGTPFDIGKWFGVDGNWVYANANPGNYSCSPACIRNEEFLKDKLTKNEKDYNLDSTVRFYGTGDRGGAPAESCVKMICNEIRKNKDENTEVKSVNDNEFFEIIENELTDEQKASLPVWDNELLMTNHGVGSYTSRSVGKRFNKQCEIFADMAERACVCAEITGVYNYPQNVLSTAWKRFIAHQFHDDITGTSFHVCYKRNWNDYILSQKQFTQELEGAFCSLSSLLDTSGVKGIAVSVMNTLQFDRHECVELEVKKPKAGKFIRVYDNGKEVPSGTVEVGNGKVKVYFRADIGGFETKVFDLRFSSAPSRIKTALYSDGLSFGNEYIDVKLDECGNIIYVFDKTVGKELLEGKAGLQLFDYMGSKNWPAWELTYKELNRKPVSFPQKAKIEIIVDTNAAIMYKVTGRIGKSDYTQIISLGCNDRTIKVYNDVVWENTKGLLKVAFPVSSANCITSYDLGLGVIKRENSKENLYEVPAQLWADVSAKDATYGVSVFSDSRAGWDKPSDGLLRLTAVHTPYYSYRQECSQNLMDLGINRFSYGIFGHSGNPDINTQRAALCFATPLLCAAGSAGHTGVESIRLGEISDSGVIVRAIKKSEDGDCYVVRFNEGEGVGKKNVTFLMGSKVTSAFETDGCERITGKAKVKDGKLVFDIGAYGLKTFLLKIKPEKQKSVIEYKNIPLPSNARIVSRRDERSCVTVPAELMPEGVSVGGFEYRLCENGTVCCGQKISLPVGTQSVRLLVNTKGDDTIAEFSADGKKIPVNIPSAFEAVGAWDLYGLKETGYIKEERLAHCFTHVRENGKDIPAKQMYLFEKEIKCGKELVLPNDDKICIYSAVAVTKDNRFSPKSVLIDKLEKRPFTFDISKGDLARSEIGTESKSILKKNVNIEIFGICGNFQIADFTSIAKKFIYEFRHWLK